MKRKALPYIWIFNNYFVPPWINQIFKDEMRPFVIWEYVTYSRAKTTNTQYRNQSRPTLERDLIFDA